MSLQGCTRTIAIQVGASFWRQGLTNGPTQRRRSDDGGQENHDHRSAEQLTVEDTILQTKRGEDNADFSARDHAETHDQSATSRDNQSTDQLAEDGDQAENQPQPQRFGVAKNSRINDGSRVDEEDRSQSRHHRINEVLDGFGRVVSPFLEECLIQSNPSEIGANDGCQAGDLSSDPVEDHEGQDDRFARLQVEAGQGLDDSGREVMSQNGNYQHKQHCTTDLHPQDQSRNIPLLVERAADRQGQQPQHVVDDSGRDDDAPEVAVEHAEFGQNCGSDTDACRGEDTSLEESHGPAGAHSVEDVDAAADHRDKHPQDSDLPASTSIVDDALDVGFQPSLEQEQHGSEFGQADDQLRFSTADLLHHFGLTS